MSETGPTHLDDEAKDEVLGAGGVGVLSFSTAASEPPHAVPVSYGYDPETTALYFRLAVSGDSTKDELLSNPATFTAYHETEDGYESVVAQGTLESVEESDVDSLDGLSRVEIPLFDVFDRDLREVEFDFYRLDASTVTGRRELQRRD